MLKCSRCCRRPSGIDPAIVRRGCPGSFSRGGNGGRGRIGNPARCHPQHFLRRGGRGLLPGSRGGNGGKRGNVFRVRFISDERTAAMSAPRLLPQETAVWELQHRTTGRAIYFDRTHSGAPDLVLADVLDRSGRQIAPASREFPILGGRLCQADRTGSFASILILDPCCRKNHAEMRATRGFHARIAARARFH